MNDYLILFENMLGVVAMRKHLQRPGSLHRDGYPAVTGQSLWSGDPPLSVSDDSPRTAHRPQVTENIPL